MEIFKLVIDFGLLLLIWLVQLIIYPSFYFMPENHLKMGHDRYMKKIAIFVIPLMFGQVFLHGWVGWFEPSILKGIAVLAILGAWLSTWYQAIPLHQEVVRKWDTKAPRKKLVATNWIRTGCWTLVFLLTLAEMLFT